MTSAIQNIPLSQLVPAPEGVRKVKSGAASIETLAADIKAHGLMQNLVVRLVPHGKGKSGKQYEVISGNRRLAALKLLVKSGDWKAAQAVPCQVRTDKESAVELGLAENFSRENMHPADQFEAFEKLVKQGQSVADIAASFGRSEASVQKLLKLAKVSPAILKAYRAGETTLEHVQAYALTDDHGQQDQVFKRMKRESWRSGPGDIRRALMRNEVPVTDSRVKYVTRAAYEQAGGKVREDLFANLDDRNHVGAYIQDAALLDKLVDEKLQKKADALLAEGWKWAEARRDFNEYSGEFKQLDPYRQKKKFTAAEMANAGVIASLDNHGGNAEIHRGLVKPGDRKEAAKTAKAKKGAAGGRDARPTEQEPGLGYSQSLITDLTAQKSAALAAVLLTKPDVALRAVVFTLAMETFLEHEHGAIGLKIQTRGQEFELVDGSPALKAVEEAKERWAKQLPKAGSGLSVDYTDKLWAWCLAASQADLLDLLALCAALTVDTVCRWQYDPEEPLDQRLSQAVGLDMAQWWTPTAESYFGRVSKDQMLAALKEIHADSPHARQERAEFAKMKKGELAKACEWETANKGRAGFGWLPEILRVKGVVNAKPGADPKAFDGKELPPDPTVGKVKPPRKARKAAPEQVPSSQAVNGTVIQDDGVKPDEMAARDQKLAAMLGSGPVLAALNQENPGGVCRVCGCTNARGCPPAIMGEGESCRWVEVAGEQSLCSRASCVAAGKLGIVGRALAEGEEASA